MYRSILALALALSTFTASAVSAQAAEEAESIELSPFQWGIEVVGTADFLAGGDDEILDVPSYLGGGLNLHLGGLLAESPTALGGHFVLTLGVRLNAEYKPGLEGLGVQNDLFTTRQQLSLGIGYNRAELLLGGGAVQTVLSDAADPGYGGSAFVEGRFGTKSGVFTSAGLNLDVYTNLYRSFDGERLITLSVFFGVGWKNLR